MLDSIPAKFGRRSCRQFWVGFGSSVAGLTGVLFVMVYAIIVSYV